MMHGHSRAFTDKAAFFSYNYQGGKSSRVVNCVLGLKAYGEWKQTGGPGVWKFGGNVKSTTSAKQFVRKNSEPFSSSLSRSMSMNEKSANGICTDAESNKMVGRLCLTNISCITNNGSMA